MSSRDGGKLGSKGFTLVELLVVVIVIGILAAFALVAYIGSQNKNHQATAQSTLAEIQDKLGVYNADHGNYPATQAGLNSWLASRSGGNDTSLSTTFTTANGYTYAPNNGTDNTCNDHSTACTAYTLTANASIWHGSSNLTVTN